MTPDPQAAPLSAPLTDAALLNAFDIVLDKFRNGEKLAQHEQQIALETATRIITVQGATITALQGELAEAKTAFSEANCAMAEGRERERERADAAEMKLGDYAAGCDIQRGDTLYRQVEVVIGPGKTVHELKAEAAESALTAAQDAFAYEKESHELTERVFARVREAHNILEPQLTEFRAALGTCYQLALSGQKREANPDLRMIEGVARAVLAPELYGNGEAQAKASPHGGMTLEEYIEHLPINDLQRASIVRFHDLIKHGSKFINLHVRKDGQEYHFEADWLRPFLKEFR